MAAFDISNFAARFPAITPTELATNQAQTATNVRIQGRELQVAPGYVSDGTSALGATTETMFRYTNSIWLEWDQDVNVVRSLIANDAWDRVLWTAETGVPMVSSNDIIATGPAPWPDAAYYLGVPPPVGAPSALVTGTATNPDDLPDTRFYVCTMVDKYGAEGVPTSPSNEVEWRAGQTCTVTLPTVPSGNWVFTAINIYRTNTGSGGTEFQKVASVGVGLGGTGWVDSIASDYLGDVLESADFDEPNGAMKGLVSTPNGYHAGFFDNTLCFSEPGYPHAWPIKYQLPIKEATIVGLEVMGDTIVVLTDGTPYLAVGTHPQSTSLVELNVTQGCLSKRGIVNTGNGVAYPGPDGIVLVRQDGATVITQSLFTRKQWQALAPSTFLGAMIEGLLTYFYFDGSYKAFMLNPMQPELGIVDYTAMHASAVYYDKDEDALYAIRTGGAGARVKFWNDAAVASSPLWRSKVIETFQAMSPGVARILASAYPVTFRLYADGALFLEAQATSNDFIRLYSDAVLSDRFELELLSLPSTGGVYRVVIGETMDDLF